jgi:hypothetical protein
MLGCYNYNNVVLLIIMFCFTCVMCKLHSLFFNINNLIVGWILVSYVYFVYSYSYVGILKSLILASEEISRYLNSKLFI